MPTPLQQRALVALQRVTAPISDVKIFGVRVADFVTAAVLDDGPTLKEAQLGALPYAGRVDVEAYAFDFGATEDYGRLAPHLSFSVSLDPENYSFAFTIGARLDASEDEDLSAWVNDARAAELALLGYMPALRTAFTLQRATDLDLDEGFCYYRGLFTLTQDVPPI